jgi:tRNA A-37 threonylcarbamoyl transferase component Bud32
VSSPTHRHPTSDRDLLLEAERAEKGGDAMRAVAFLRAHLALHATDGAARLRLGRLLFEIGEWASAREVVSPLDRSEDPGVMAGANRLLARMDATEGALGSAQIRWERALADDIDDPEAHAELRALGPRPENPRWASDLSLATIQAPEGVRMSRFKLIRELGRGATAAVYLVRDEVLDLPLALKVLHPQLAAASRADAREKFFAEARLAARLRHPGVVAIYGVDQAARCLAMEFVAGGTLRDRLRASPSGIDPVDAITVARSLLDGLQYVHGAGIVHGDLKPGNILFRQPTQVVLVDFGIAQQASSVVSHDDRSAGTPLYLAPEQFRGAPSSPATDLFAVGVIVWEMLSGRPARRQGDLPWGLDAAAHSIAIDALSPRNDDARRLATLVAALTSTDPTLRPAAVTARGFLG